MTNLTKYKKDLDALIQQGDLLSLAMNIECEVLNNRSQKYTDEEFKKICDALPSIKSDYQIWYSEAVSVIKLIIPDRLNNFVQYYEKSKTRRVIDYESYVIEDYLQELIIKKGGQIIVSKSAAINKLAQQVAILKSCKRKFESSLFDIKQLLLADIFDTEIDSAKELNRKGFYRASGAIIGVILESHFEQVCKNHNLPLPKKYYTINEYNDLLKKHEIIEIETFRHIQLLGDIRNKCDHKKEQEPTKKDIDDLISGAEKIIKSVY